MESVKEKQKKAYNEMKGDFGYSNKFETPKLIKVVVSSGIGKIQDKNKIAVIEDRLTKLTGQKPSPRGAKKSVASFKIRQGDIVGYQVTLRGKRMYDFVDRLIQIALPRTRDFRGLGAASIDEVGNYTIGIREHTAFPETSDEELKDIFGFSVTIVTSAKTKKEAEAFLRHIGLPLKK